MRLSLNQRGISNVLFPLIILAAIGLGVYLIGQQTELTPSAEEAVPTGCKKITPVSRSVCYKKSVDSPPEQCQQDTGLDGEGKNDHPDYDIKEVTWTFSNGWKNVSGKGKVQDDGDRMDLGSMPGRFDSPGGKSFEKIDDDPISSNGSTRDGAKISYRVKGGQAVVAEFAYTTEGTNYQGVQGKKYDSSKSYAFVPENENSSVRCDGVGSSSKTGTKSSGDSCTEGNECKSGVCTNKKCANQGNKAGGESCSDGVECQSGTCSNKKCAGGTRTSGSACDKDSDCASNNCDNNKCSSSSGKGASGASCSSGSECASGTCTNNRCTAASPSPRSSGSNSSGGGNNNGSGASTTPSASIPASVAPSASPATSASPAASGSVTPVPVSLTKTEITGFRNSYNALNARLGAASSSGNLKVTANIAKSELDSIVSQLPTCPDDANVGTCLDSKFRTRFDFAKTAARLTAFYAIFNNVSGLCVKSDFGLNPLITATSQNNTQGRVNLCTEPTAAQKIWRIFANGKFEPVLSTDTKWPANPTCATLPQDVLDHYRNAEKLFSTQAGFAQNTACDGKTTFEPPGGTT